MDFELSRSVAVLERTPAVLRSARDLPWLTRWWRKLLDRFAEIRARNLRELAAFQLDGPRRGSPASIRNSAL